MTKNASSSGEPGAAPELYPVVAAVASLYGDPTGKYKQYLQKCVINILRLSTAFACFSDGILRVCAVCLSARIRAKRSSFGTSLAGKIDRSKLSMILSLLLLLLRFPLPQGRVGATVRNSASADSISNASKRSLQKKRCSFRKIVIFALECFADCLFRGFVCCTHSLYIYIKEYSDYLFVEMYRRTDG